MKQTILGIILGGIVALSCTHAIEKSSSITMPSNSATVQNDQTPDPADSTTWRKLTKEEENVIVFKGTEYPGTGSYVTNHEQGIYHCKRCNAALFSSESKFESGTGWPSFDAYLKNAVQEVPDADGYRTEIVCNNCKGHLGHAFFGEGFTKNNTRHCVNSISLSFEEYK